MDMRIGADVTSQTPPSAMRRITSLERNLMGGVSAPIVSTVWYSNSLRYCRFPSGLRIGTVS